MIFGNFQDFPKFLSFFVDFHDFRKFSRFSEIFQHFKDFSKFSEIFKIFGKIRFLTTFLYLCFETKLKKIENFIKNILQKKFCKDCKIARTLKFQIKFRNVHFSRFYKIFLNFFLNLFIFIWFYPVGARSRCRASKITIFLFLWLDYVKFTKIFILFYFFTFFDNFFLFNIFSGFLIFAVFFRDVFDLKNVEIW